MPPFATRGGLTTVHKSFPKGLSQLFDLSKVLVISISFSGEKRMKAVVQIVIPLGIQSIASFLGRIDDPDVVKIAFGDHPNRTTQFLYLLVNGFPDFVQDVLGTKIEDAMDGVDSKTIDMIFRHPVKGIINDEVSDLIALRTIEVDRRTPWGLIAVGKIGSIIGKVVPLRPQMVVDYIQNDS
jgi:hypothetical protein